jgi:hypothetical protein
MACPTMPPPATATTASTLPVPPDSRRSMAEVGVTGAKNLRQRVRGDSPVKKSLSAARSEDCARRTSAARPGAESVWVRFTDSGLRRIAESVNWI